MESRIIVDRVWLAEEGRRVNYSYRATGRAEKFFAGRPQFYAVYDADLRAVPESILLIPLIANLAPIAWFGGLSLDVETLDMEFLAALEKIKSVFLRDYPSILTEGSRIVVAKPVVNAHSGNKTAMLFSGGVDAYATFFRHRAEMPDLVSIHGADIPLTDSAQWNAFVKLTDQEPLLAAHSRRHIQANLRDFYTYHVNLLVPSKAWWGAVQHGLALNAVVAPLGAALGYSRLYIASSYTDAIQIKWGSTPEIDNSIAWAGCSVCHDGYELQRIDKVGVIAAETSSSADKVKLRVCYSELNHGLNCSNCEKCFRTMLGLSLHGVNPARYGFDITPSSYQRILDLIKAGFKSQGARYFWWELNSYMKSNSGANFYLLGEVDEHLKVFDALSMELERPVKSHRPQAMKMAIIERFPRLFAMYLKVRRWFL